MLFVGFVGDHCDGLGRHCFGEVSLMISHASVNGDRIQALAQHAPNNRPYEGIRDPAQLGLADANSNQAHLFPAELPAGLSFGGPGKNTFVLY